MQILDLCNRLPCGHKDNGADLYLFKKEYVHSVLHFKSRL